MEPLFVPLEWILGAASTTAGGLWWTYRLGRISMADHLKLSEQKEGLETLRAIGLNEDLATCKQTLQIGKHEFANSKGSYRAPRPT